MARKTTPLRTVKPDERSEPKAPPKTIVEAIAEGTPIEMLEALRLRCATEAQDPNCPARDLAALTRRVQELTKDIEALKAAANDDDGAAETPDDQFDAAAI